MPEHHLDLSDADAALLARVQARYSMPSLSAAAEWLVKARLRRMARASAGRGRALYVVAGRGARGAR